MLFKRLASVLLVALLACCGDDHSVAPDADRGRDASVDASAEAIRLCQVQDGSRLKIRQLVPADGTPRPEGIWDSELKTQCSFRDDGRGRLRCAPPVAGSISYLDSECSRPMARFYNGEEPSRFTAETRVGGSVCAREETIYPVYTDTAILPIQVYAQTGAGCVVSTQTGVQYYSLDNSIEEELVSGHKVLEGSGRTQLEILVGADGSRFCGQGEEMYDSQLETDCQPDYDSTGTLRCLPKTLQQAEEGFADAACTVPARVLYPPLCGSPLPYATLPVDLGCAGTGYKIFPTGGVRQEPFFSSFGEGQCIPHNGRLHQVGSEIAAEDFDPLQVLDAGEGRLRARVFIQQQSCKRRPSHRPVGPTPLSAKNVTPESARMACCAAFQSPALWSCRMSLPTQTAPSPWRRSAPRAGGVPQRTSPSPPSGSMKASGVSMPFQGCAAHPAYGLESGVCAPVDRILYNLGARLAPTTFVELELR